MVRRITPPILLLAAALSASGAPQGILDLDQVPEKGVTEVWSPLFQATWDKLSATQKGKLEKVVPANPLITHLDGFQWKEEEVMPPEAYLVFAGPADAEFARATAKAIKEKFGHDIEMRSIPASPGSLAAFGFLLRELRFEKKFFRSRTTALEFRASDARTHKVAFFGTAGTHSWDFGAHVKVLDYKNGGKTFVLSIATDHKDERLILYRPERAMTFRQAMDHVKAARESPLSGPAGSENDGALHGLDVVKIPYLTLDADTDFAKQLRGSLHFAGGQLPWRVGTARQKVRFELFEEGARVRVETDLSIEPFGPAPPPPPRPTPRQFICDNPFFVFLWRDKADWPYLAAWIDGKDGLTPFKAD
jgi:hypothetical protein